MSLKVAIYCVCKNEAANVAAWLDTAKAADVIVAADTGSTDSTPFKFEGRGDKVRSHEISVSPWRFDTARNAALALVPGDVDVCISLDMDERLAPNWRMVLERHWKPGTTNAYYTYIFNHKPDGSPDLVYLHDRIHSRHGWRWVFPDHEGLYPDRITPQPVTMRDFVIEQWQDRAKDRSGILARLEAGLKETPDHPRMLFYYARELSYASRYKEAIPLLERYLTTPTLGVPFAVERAQAAECLAQCWQKM